MAFPFSDYARGRVKQLVQFRTRYAQDEYPYKVAMNIFYELYPLELSWAHFEQASFECSEAYDYQTASVAMNEQFRNFQRSIAHEADDLFKMGMSVLGVDFSWYLKQVEKANQRDNEAVEELEFCFVARSVIRNLFQMWCISGLMGHDKEEAFAMLSNTIVPVIGNFDDKNEVVEGMKMMANAELGGMQGDPRAGRRPSDNIIKIGGYSALPPLW